MPEGFGPWAEIAKGFGWAGIAVLTVISIIRGWLWPGWTVTKLLEDKDKQIQNLWKAREADQNTIALLTNQVHQLQHNGEMSLLLLEALRGAAGRAGQERKVLGELAAADRRASDGNAVGL